MRKGGLVKSVIIALLAGYSLFFVFIYYFSVASSTEYETMQKNYSMEANTKLNEIILQGDVVIEEQIPKLIKKYPMELIIYKDIKVVYETIPTLSDESVKEALNKDVVVSIKQGMIPTNTGDYYIWYSLYYVPEEAYVESYFWKQTVFITGMFMILLAVSIYVQYILVKPIQKLKKALTHAGKYEFDKIEDSEDVVNQEFHTFAQKIRNVVYGVSRKHTELESTLQIERERIANRMTMIRAMIHDIKTPIHEQLLENEHFEVQQVEDVFTMVEEMKEYNLSQSDFLIKEVNQMLLLLNEDMYTVELKYESFNLVEEVIQTRKLFRGSLAEKNLLLEIITPEYLEITTNKITMKLLLHNILSNATKYAEIGSEIILDIFEENNEIMIICKNDASTENIQRMKKSEELFHVFEENHEKEHKYSSGNGLYLIKELSELMQSDFSYIIEQNTVVITLQFELGAKQK